MIPFTALAQGLLTDKYLDGIPANARVNKPGGGSFDRSMLNEANLGRVRGLDGIAKQRGQTLAQMAYAWALRDPRVTTTLMGASSPEQVRENVGALSRALGDVLGDHALAAQLAERGRARAAPFRWAAAGW